MPDFRCTIVTPSDSVLDERATYVSFAAWDGQKGVAPGSSPFLVCLGSGSVRIDTASGKSHRFAINGGFAQMQKNELTLLADNAVSAEAIDAKLATSDLKAANERVTAINAKPLSLEQREQLERDQSWAQSRIALARSRG